MQVYVLVKSKDISFIEKTNFTAAITIRFKTTPSSTWLCKERVEYLLRLKVLLISDFYSVSQYEAGSSLDKYIHKYFVFHKSKTLNNGTLHIPHRPWLLQAV